MKVFFLGKLLAWAGRKTDGYKTKVGGVGLILTGLVGLLGHLYPDQGLPTMEIESALTTISLGVTALGLGGKAEKIVGAINRAPTGPVTDATAEADRP